MKNLLIVIGMWLILSALIYGFMSGAIVNALGETLVQSLIAGAILVFFLVGLALRAAEKP